MVGVGSVSVGGRRVDRTKQGRPESQSSPGPVRNLAAMRRTDPCPTRESPVTPWPHQTEGVSKTLSAIQRGVRRLVLTSPTGGGKSRMMHMLCEDFAAESLEVVVYTNRRMLVDQLSNSFSEAGLLHGVRAAGHEDLREAKIQIASIQTEHARKHRWRLHPAQRVIVDEAHLMNNPMARAIFDRHYEDGAAIIFVTATPLGLSDMADELIIAGTNSELRACGALVRADHFGPDEPDLKGMKLREGVDLTESQNVEAMKPKRIWGRVIEWYEKTNPDRRPSILFAPGVKESLWYAQELTKAGIPAAHIDGQHVWWDGELYRSSQSVREDILSGSREGQVKVLCNRFVLREGIDAPWLYHGIFACVFGSIQSYLQSGGRLLRAHPSLDHVVIQDHGGHWHRHGSLNADRAWDLEDTNERIAARRVDRFREKKEREPRRCPQCAKILAGLICPCGYKQDKKVRPVLQIDGTLKELMGDVYKPRRIYHGLDGPKKWERMYWRSRSAKGTRTFRAAFALFAMENNFCWPDRSWPLMPINERDVYRDVADVAMDQLTKGES